MSATPRVLALVPYLRSQPRLEQCLVSLASQTRPLDGMLVLDDATPQPPVDLVRRFPGVTLWRAPEPLGLRGLLARAVRSAHADWYLLCDPEGWSSPQRLERLLEHAGATGAGLVGGRVLTFGPSRATTTRRSSVGRAALGEQARGHATGVLAAMARRDVLAGLTGSGSEPDVAVAPHVLSFRTEQLTAPGAELRLTSPPGRIEGRRRAAWERLAGPRPRRRRPWPVRWPSSGVPARHQVLASAPQPQELPGPVPSSFVEGTSSGALPLFWALAQHPALRAVVDTSWVVPMADARAALLADVNARSADGPDAGALRLKVDQLVRRTADDATALAGGDRHPFVARLPEGSASVDAVIALFPGARVLRVLDGDADRGPAPHGQVLQVQNADVVERTDSTVARCLSFLGLPPHRGCSLALAAAVQAQQQDPEAGLGHPPGVPAHVTGPLRLLQDLPPHAVVAAVTKGDGALDAAAEVEVRHFPQTADGEWAGYHPADTSQILRHLGTLQLRGTTHFLVPAWSAWWLDHYEGLSDALSEAACLVAHSDDGGRLYELRADARRSRSRPARRSITVVSWDTSHNPLGRAHVLAELLADRYDVEIVGARFPSFGSALWRPLRDAEMPIRTFPGLPFPEFVAEVERFSRTITSDAVLVSKPRLPSLALGLLASLDRPRPVLLDIDDRELTFVGASDPLPLTDLAQVDDAELTNPYGRQWTRACESLVGLTDAITVSNPALQALFGGTIIPHARDERVFDPSRVDRQEARRAFGFLPDDRVVLFGGTPRRHKGVVELAAAVHALRDPRAKLCLIATDELRELRTLLAPYAGVLVEVPYQPFERLPDLLAAVDAVAVLQDPQSEVSDFQMPAKITDAMAMQLPCIVREVPPLASLVAEGHLLVVGPDGLAATLERVLSDPAGARERAGSAREAFLNGYSFGAVRPRLESLVESALSRPPEPRPGAKELRAVMQDRARRATPSGSAR